MAKNKDVRIYKGSITEKYNNEALDKKAEFEKMMAGDEVPDSLKEELTRLYAINNLLLISMQN